MRVGIVGLGAAGQRYARLLRERGLRTGECFDLGTCRRRKRNQLIAADMKSAIQQDPALHFGIREYHSIESLAAAVDCVVIASPPSLHVADAIPFVAKGIPCLIEKPLFTSMQEAESLRSAAASGGGPVMAAYLNRRHPVDVALSYFVAHLPAGSTPVLIESWYQEDTRFTHPYEDYRSSHTLRRDQGGGALLCLSHELELWTRHFPGLSVVHASLERRGDLEDGRDVEDYAQLFLTDCGANYPVEIRVTVDLVTSPPRRGGRLNAGVSKFDWNFMSPEVSTTLRGSAESQLLGAVDRDQLFEHLLSDLIGATRLGGDRSEVHPEIQQSTHIQRIIDDARSR